MPHPPLYSVTPTGADACHTPPQPDQAAPVYQATPQQAKPEPTPEPEPPPDAFHIAPAWVDSARRTRTWRLLDNTGGHIAEITTKRDAQKLADIFNHIREDNRGRSR